MQAMLYAFNDDQFRGFQTRKSVVGSASPAKQIQKTVHKLVGSDDLKGWDHKLFNEPVINFNLIHCPKMHCIH